MNPKNIVLVGVKGSVIALDRATGQRLWTTELKTTLGNNFVSVIADERHVYAHSGGELCCLDLFSGSRLWHDDLPGLGYGIGCIALPDAQSTTLEAIEYERNRCRDTTVATSASP